MIGDSANEAQIVEAGRAAYRLGWTGDFRSSDEILESLKSDERPFARAWCLALNAQRWHADPTAGHVPGLVECAAFEGSDELTKQGAAIACAEAAKWAVLKHDRDALQTWVDLGSRLSDGSSDRETSVWATLGRAWIAIADGDPDVADDFSEGSGVWASEQAIAPALIESIVIRAHAAALRDEVSEAIAFARTAVRMARTEDLPQWQYLASLTLARMRRLSGMPHLTARILRPLVKSAPSAWRPWVAWEALAAGALPFGNGIEVLDEDDPLGHTKTLAKVLKAAEEGDREAFRKSSNELEALAASWKSRQRDATMLLAALDVHRELEGAAASLEGWCLRNEPSPPAAIRGLCIDLESDPADPGAAAFVVASPGSNQGEVVPRRVVGLAERLLSDEAKVPRIVGKFERNLTTLATLGLAGKDGIDRDVLFRVVYGFEYDLDLHGNLLRSLIHRVRQLLGEHGKVTLRKDRYFLELEHTLVIPDPRGGQSLEDLALRVIARTGAAGAKRTADQLKVPLRTLQTALKHLVDDGSLVVEREGKHILYNVEDTTFSEPTKWGITKF